MEIIGSLIIAISQSILFYGKNIGISMCIFMIITTSILWTILYKKKKIVNMKAIWLMIPILLLSSTYFIFDNEVFYLINILVIFALNIIMFLIATQKHKEFKEYLYQSLALIRNTIKKIKDAVKITKKSTKVLVKGNSKFDKRKIIRFFTSLFIVSCVVVVIIILLASADRIFANIFSGFPNIFSNQNIKSLIRRFICIIISYLISLGFIIAIQNNTVEDSNKRTVVNKDKFTIKMLLAALNIVYFVFCYIQIHSLFAKINLVGTFNYAEYARSGFFQLMFVSFINFALIFISNKNNENRETMIKVLNLLMVVFTAIIIASSMYRMNMYEAEYGLTYLRMFVYIILTTELVILIPTIMYILSSKVDLLKWVTIIGICVYVGINFINLENIIITRNITKHKSKVPVDYHYISKIASSNSYEILEKILENKDINTREKLNISNTMLTIANNSSQMKWQEFNISKYNLNNRKIDTKKLKAQIEKLQKEYEKELRETVQLEDKYYIYDDMINETEGYKVELIDEATGSALWTIYKTTNGGISYSKINTIDVNSSSKIEFFENGLGFLEEPASIYREKADLYITQDSGETFTKINFPEGKFTLSDSKGKKWSECYDYFYLPIKESDGTLTVLVSGGYEEGYNEGKTRAKYVSKDNGTTWKFETEILK